MIKQLAGVTCRLTAVVTAGTGGLAAAVYKGLNPLRTSRRGVYAATITAVKRFFLGGILWSSGLALAPTSLRTPNHGSMTLFAFLFIVLLLRERRSARAIAGAFLVFGSVFLTSISG